MAPRLPTHSPFELRYGFLVLLLMSRSFPRVSGCSLKGRVSSHPPWNLYVTVSFQSFNPPLPPVLYMNIQFVGKYLTQHRAFRGHTISNRFLAAGGETFDPGELGLRQYLI